MKNIRKKLLCFLAALTTTSSAMTSFAANGIGWYSLDASNKRMTVGSKIYTLNKTGGVSAFIPWNGMSEPTTIAAEYKAMINNAGYTAGETAKTSAFREAYGSINGIYIKYANQAVLMSSTYGNAEGYSSNSGNSYISSNIWQPGIWDLRNSDHLVSFRFAGVSPVGEEAVISTSPMFVQDTISTRPSAGPLGYATIYTKNSGHDVSKGRQEPFYGTPRDITPLSWGNIYPCGKSGASSLPTTAKSNYNKDLSKAKKTFEAWALTPEGSLYKKMLLNDYKNLGYNESNYWQALNEKFRIEGDIDALDSGQAVYLTCHHKWEGKTYYRTYMIQGYAKANAFPMQINVLDDKNTLMEKSRNVAGDVTTSLVIGASQERNVLNNGQAVALERNKSYKIEGTILAVNRNEDAIQDEYAHNTRTLKDNITIFLTNENLQPIKLLSGQSAKANLVHPDGTAAIGGVTDGKNSVSDDGICLDYMQTVFVPKIDIDDMTFSANDEAVFGNYNFELGNVVFDDTMPATGYIGVTLGNTAQSGLVWTMNGDNDIQNDDVLYLHYRLVNGETITEAVKEGSYGDMDIGTQEYRRLVWADEIEVENEEDSDDDSDSDSGNEGDGEEKEKEPIKVTKYSDWGIYDSPEAAKANESSYETTEFELPSSVNTDSEGRYWSTGNGSDEYWEYYYDDSHYDPEITNTEKITLGGDAATSDGYYLRSGFDTEYFDLTALVSNTRGQTSVQTPKVIWRVYGISPETDDDGELISVFNTDTDSNLGISGFLSQGAEIPEYSTGTVTADGQQKGLYIGLNASDSDMEHDSYWPQIRVVADISEDWHGDSGFSGLSTRAPYDNALEPHDHAERVFTAEPDDMYISEVILKDSEGVVIYHAYKENAGEELRQIIPENDGKPIFDRDEDYVLTVRIKQNESANHAVNNPTIDVTIDPKHNGSSFTIPYIDKVQTGGTTDNGYADTMDATGNEYTEYEFPFRASQMDGDTVDFSITIDEIHDEWQENQREPIDDDHEFTIKCTECDLELTQDIELYNSKNNKKDYLEFMENQAFKFDIRHIGSKDDDAEKMVVGNTGNGGNNPYASVETTDASGNEYMFSHNKIGSP